MIRAGPVFAAWLGWVLFVVYGSLVPLDFVAMPIERAVAAFKNIPFLSLGIASRADWVANGVLYVPLGLLSAKLLFAALPRLPWALAIPLAWAGCAGLAVAVEFAQLFFPPRTVSQNDLIAEGIGSAVGALLAPVLAGWVGRLGAGWFAGGSALLRRLLEGYALAYVLLCFFPYDLLLSWPEVQGKWASGLWGWVLAPNERGGLFALLQLLVETGLALPIGVLLARRAATVGLLRAAMVGATLGGLIELGQFLVASGVSQGASVLTRALGVALGVALAPALGHGGVPAVKALWRRHAGALFVLYLPVLLFVNGWFREPWQGLAAATAVWQELRLLPFYYHYWTTEALALFSLGSVALMYLPAALLGWARGLPRPVVLTGVAMLALAVETSKLFITGLRPDPTNLLVAAATSAVALWLLGLSAQARVPVSAGATAVPGAVPNSRPARSAASTWRLSWVVLPAVLTGAGLWAWWFPAVPGLLLALLGGAVLAVWQRPVWALALIPAALPVLELAPWSGRFYWDEFDLLLAVCISVALRRTPARARPAYRLRPLTLAFALLALSLLVATLRALLPWQGLDLNSFSSYCSPLNALRIFKGAVWAVLFVLLWRRLAASGSLRAQVFGAGMAAGLALTVAFVWWERSQAVSLLDFNADFRVSGPIAAMHKGGAYLECWLAVSAAFVMAWTVRTPHGLGRIAGMVLLAATGFAVMVTFSRNGYAALWVALVMAALAATRVGARPAANVPHARGTGRRLAWAGLALVLVAAAAVPVLMGSFARERLAQTATDLAVRQAHWADALQMRDRDAATSVFGMGLGRFPETHFWRSAEPRAAAYRLAREGDNTFLRLGGGATLYIEQVLPDLASDELTLTLDLRASRAPAALAVTVCRKWGLSSQACVPGRATAPGAANAPGDWQSVTLRLNVAELRATAGAFSKPMKLSLLTPDGDTRVDVDRIRLSTADGRDLLANGDFSAGMDHWFFATDVDPPWHIHSLPVAVLFDQGWFGVFAWGLVIVLMLARGAPLAWQGRAQVPAALAGLAAFLTSGSLNTLIDAPRFLALLLMLLWLAAASSDDEQGQRPAA